MQSLANGSTIKGSVITNFSNAEIGKQASAVELPAKEGTKWTEGSTHATYTMESRRNGATAMLDTNYSLVEDPNVNINININIKP